MSPPSTAIAEIVRFLSEREVYCTTQPSLEVVPVQLPAVRVLLELKVPVHPELKILTTDLFKSNTKDIKDMFWKCCKKVVPNQM